MMSLQSLSLSFSVPLAFHSLNNEGVSGNVMEPRRITINEAEYDGISGEMVRRHILENFIRLCDEQKIKLADECKGLVPERGKETLKTWMQSNNVKALLPKQHYGDATTYLLNNCALSDVGGYLIPLQEKEDKVKGTLKRDSCFEVGWLITENPAVVEFTQGVAYNADPGENKLFTQNMRTGTYSGVFRFDLGRVGRNDWAWLSPGAEVNVLDSVERARRITALLDALEQWLLSPSGARQAGWLQHQSAVRRGIFCLSDSGPAPFVSPLSIDLENKENPVAYNADFRDHLKELAAKRPGKLECFEFNSLAELATAFDNVRERIRL